MRDVSGQVLDSSQGIGMTVRRVFGYGGMRRACKGWAAPAHTPRGTRGRLERASARAAQPTPGMDSRSESGMTEIGGGGKRGSECPGGMGDLHLPSPDSSLPFGMTVRGVGGYGGMRRIGKGWAAPRSTLRVTSGWAAPPQGDPPVAPTGKVPARGRE